MVPLLLFCLYFGALSVGFISYFFLLFYLIRFSVLFVRLCVLFPWLCRWLVCVGPRKLDVIGDALAWIAERRCRETMVEGPRSIMSTDSPGLMDQETGAKTLWDCPEF